MRTVELGPLTDEEMVQLLKDVLYNMPEGDVLPILRDWIKDNNLQEEFY